MDDVINYLQGIQDDLVGIIIPLAITAVVSIFSIAINSISKFIFYLREYFNGQREIKKEVYPQLKNKIICIEYKMLILRKNEIFEDIITSLKKYDDYKKNPTQYREKNTKELNNIDNFINSVYEYLNELNGFYDLLSKKTMPDLPIFRFWLKYRIKKNLTLNYYFAFLSQKYVNNEIDGDYYVHTLNNFKKRFGYKFDEKSLMETDHIFDAWFVKNGII